MSKIELIDMIYAEMSRIWGVDGFQGLDSDYKWLQATYDISEEEDVLWQEILGFEIDDLHEDEWEDEELMSFLNDNSAVIHFLENLLEKYRKSSDVAPETPEELSRGS
jgi:hypothetical protein